MARNRDDRSSEQQWNFHVWGNPYQMDAYQQERIGTAMSPQNRRELEITNELIAQGRGRSDAMVDLQVQATQADQARGGDGAPMGGPNYVGPQQFDGDSIAWKAFLSRYGQATGGKWNRYQDRTIKKMQANAARIDAARRSDYLRYIEAGGTSGYNDWLIENDLHARQGGW